LIAKFSCAVDHSFNLFYSEDVRQYFLLGRFNDVDPGPFFVKGVLVEELKSISVDLNGTPGMAFDESGEILFKMFLG